MAAGLGFKDFQTGEVLTAADVDGYLMQGVWVFASAAARDAAVTSPQEGNFAYLKDTNVTTYYTGSAWANLDTTGMTNPMTTTGDIIYSSSGSTPARLGIGSTGNVLTVAGGVPSWAAPAGGGGALIQTVPTSVAVGSGTATVNAAGTVTFTSVNTNLSINGCFNSTYTNYKIIVDAEGDSANVGVAMRMRVSGSDNTTASSYRRLQTEIDTGTTVTNSYSASDQWTNMFLFGSGGTSAFDMSIFRPFTTQMTAFTQENNTANFSTGLNRWICNGFHNQTTSYDGFSLLISSAITGKIRIYGWSE